MMNQEENKELSFQERYKAFKDGQGSAPILYKTVGFKSSADINESNKQIILSLEEKDADGEVVEISGGRIRNENNGIPMIDSHNSFSSVVTNGLGAVRNPKFTEINGKPALIGDPDFAPTLSGEQAKILYMGVNGGKPYFTDVSMGFMVFDYDNETKTIKEWEVFELSLVTAGANRGARFIDKSLEGSEIQEEPTQEDMQIAKDLARFKQIQEPFKEFSKLFLSEEFCKTIGYVKDGDLLVDINSLYDIIKSKFVVEQEAPKPTEEAPQKLREASPEQVNKALLDAILMRLR